MLIMVYKADEEKEAEAEIVKYSDRIWFDSTGGAKCLRSVIIHVLDRSPKPLSQLCFVMPVPRNNITGEIVDKSETCTDIGFGFNSFKTGGYRVESREKDGGVIYNDGFENVRVRYGNKFNIIGIGNTSVLQATFSEAIQRGEFREVRVGFSVSSLAIKFKEDTYAIDLPYFGDSTSLFNYKEAINQVKGHEEIPVIPIYNRETRQGGFDVILYLPPGMEGHDFPALTKKSIDRHNQDGTEAEEREKYMWRLREATDALQVAFGVRLSIAGNWSYGMEPKIRAMSTMTTFILMKLSDVTRSVSKSLWIGIAALIIAAAALAISLLW